MFIKVNSYMSFTLLKNRERARERERELIIAHATVNNIGLTVSKW